MLFVPGTIAWRKPFERSGAKRYHAKPGADFGKPKTVSRADKALASVVTLLNVDRKPVIYRGRPRKCAFFDSFSNGCEAWCAVGNVLGSVYRKFAALLLAPLRLIFSPFLDLATFPISERLLDIMSADQQIKTCFSKCDRCFLPWKP